MREMMLGGNPTDMYAIDFEAAIIASSNMFVDRLNNGDGPMGLSVDGFLAATNVFANCMGEMMWNLQQAEGMDLADRENMADKLGKEIRRLINVYTGIET